MAVVVCGGIACCAVGLAGGVRGEVVGCCFSRVCRLLGGGEGNDWIDGIRVSGTEWALGGRRSRNGTTPVRLENSSIVNGRDSLMMVI